MARTTVSNPTVIGRATRQHREGGGVHPGTPKRHEAGGGVQNRKRPLLQSPDTNTAPVQTVAPAARELAQRAAAEKPAASPATGKPKDRSGR